MFKGYSKFKKDMMYVQNFNQIYEAISRLDFRIKEGMSSVRIFLTQSYKGYMYAQSLMLYNFLRNFIAIGNFNYFFERRRHRMTVVKSPYVFKKAKEHLLLTPYTLTLTMRFLIKNLLFSSFLSFGGRVNKAKCVTFLFFGSRQKKIISDRSSELQFFAKTRKE